MKTFLKIFLPRNNDPLRALCVMCIPDSLNGMAKLSDSVVEASLKGFDLNDMIFQFPFFSFLFITMFFYLVFVVFLKPRHINSPFYRFSLLITFLLISAWIFFNTRSDHEYKFLTINHLSGERTPQHFTLLARGHYDPDSCGSNFHPPRFFPGRTYILFLDKNDDRRYTIVFSRYGAMKVDPGYITGALGTVGGDTLNGVTCNVMTEKHTWDKEQFKKEVNP
ncbi:MAG: hypothetical protein A2Y03_00715 [Omnitrophica WOR_2 bacterium GWF2_38_59]|nr:MAG: hypothetical protein A2Y03_00715 [Omnitrophica WOR_2 bacterium GWF2_38_59]OGX49502.1 MAG: hypothetical protein A2243_10495 [Omnitrophica WOR_2 bacterium RIFOXYA2_FULL_38_17]